ncbi:MAG: PAS domain S-box protein [Symplocastrum torsivum CPER-KK1]|jgi:PAS domain S-box-containing protein|uniref:PAS domain S-box protein n=1 Tax=Symplocastrum torsivum CPER-KK1 TaxID=450513 RepID=A0A951UC84_9CYAN|nr:PAS domain S-box protein [Symplocastrum torsivum CPER-KK1]
MTETLWEIEQQFQTLFKFASTGIALISPLGMLSQTNQSFQELFGYTAEELKNFSFIELTYPDDRGETSKIFQEILVGNRTHCNWEKQYCRKDGRLIWANISATLVCDANDLPRYVLIMIQDTCGHKQAHSSLQDAQARLEKQVLEQTAELTQMNQLLKQEIAERQKVQESLQAQQEFLQTLFNLYPNTIFARGSFAVVTDANTLQSMESELQQAKEQLRAVLDAMPGFVAWINSEGKYLGVNQYMADAFNLSPDIFIGQELGFLKNSPNLAEFMTHFIAESIQTSNQVVEAQINGSTRNYLVAAQKYCQNSLAVIVGIDITKHKEAEAQIQASLQEKEVLLQEVHHRVKNNLQVISSLLDLQSQQIEEQATLEIFRESQNRVKSMALVHEKLYKSQDFAKINFAEYTESLTSYLFKAYQFNRDKITLELTLDEVTLNIDTAIPCGLIVNELVSNSLKHAFPNNQSGTIRISMFADETQQFNLIVEDNGVGFPPDWNLKQSQSLGIQLVHVLTKQIKGKVELNNSLGSRFCVSFPVIKD